MEMQKREAAKRGGFSSTSMASHSSSGFGTGSARPSPHIEPISQQPHIESYRQTTPSSR